VVSVQVLNEFVNVARRKLRFDWNEVMRALDDLTTLLDAPMPLTMEVHRSGLDIARRFGFGSTIA
jgi:predicted nucleic acid-binding protein